MRGHRIGQVCRRIVAEPLIQFLLLGAVLYAVVAERQPRGDAEIRITAAEQTLMGTQFERNNRRAPSAEERQKLIEQRVHERVLVREAQRLGLDQGDDIVRRRLLQKMQFVLQSRAQAAAPSSEQLRAYFHAHAERYAQPAQYTLEHIFLRQSAQAQAAAEALLKTLSASMRGGSAGDHFDYGYRFVARTLSELRDIFGPSFTDQLQGYESGPAWFGPVRSLYGQHLLRISAVQPPALPRFEAVTEQVYADWMATEQARLLDTQTAELLGHYEVLIEAADAP